MGVEPFVRELDEARDPGSLPRVATYLLVGDRRIAAAAARAIDRLLDPVPPSQLPRLDEAVRRALDRGVLDPARSVREHAYLGVHVLGVLSFHANGYVREHAVRRLAAMTHGAALSYLLLRLTDRVPQVRNAALHALHGRGDAVDAYARNFALVRRAGFFVSSFATPEGEAALLAELRRGDLPTARAIARMLLEREPSAAAVEACATASDAVIRSWVAPRVPRRLVEDPAPAVRHAALRELARVSPAEARPFAERAVLDTSGSMRELARSLAPADFASIYRAAMQASVRPRQLVPAIAGLSETGLAADAAHVAPYLAHGSAAVRRAAVKGVMRLDGETYAERVSLLLDDPAAGVSAAARNALRPHARILGAASLRSLFAAASTPHARRNVVHLIAELSKWQSIPLLLEAVLNDHAAETAAQHVRKWNASYNSNQTPPSRQEVEAFAAALAAAEASLDPKMARELGFVRRSFLP